MGMPSKCTIVRATGRPAYKLEAKHTKETPVFCVRKEITSKGPYIFRKFSLYP